MSIDRSGSMLTLYQLLPEGILAIHITNRHFGLAPVVRRLAAKAGLTAVSVSDKREKKHGVDGNDWILLTTNEEFLIDFGLLKAKDEWPVTGPVWPVDFISIFYILKLRKLLRAVGLRPRSDTGQSSDYV